MKFNQRRRGQKTDVFEPPRRITTHKSTTLFIHEVTRGFIEDTSLRKRYEKLGFGLETVFEKQEWAEDRIGELKQIYRLNDDDIRLVNHISTPETGEKPAWEIYVKSGKELPLLFLNSNEEE